MKVYLQGFFTPELLFDGEIDSTSNMGIFLVSNFGLYNWFSRFNIQSANVQKDLADARQYVLAKNNFVVTLS